jgi:hypothetical protein
MGAASSNAMGPSRHEYDYTPRALCYSCGGPDVGQITPIDARDAPSD